MEIHQLRQRLPARQPRRRLLPHPAAQHPRPVVHHHRDHLGVTQAQRASFTVTGGNGLAGKTVHVWSSNFDPVTGGPAQWFVHQTDITPVGGRFTLTIQPRYVYSLTTTTRQGQGTVTGPPPADLPLPYTNDLSA